MGERSAANRARNSAMAKRMKEQGTTRTNATCTVCSRPVHPSHLVTHIAHCGGNYQTKGG